MSDWYYSPEEFGLEQVGEIEWRSEDYSFDLTVVWFHHASGKFVLASDAGCSCPSPFEDYTEPPVEGDLYAAKDLKARLAILLENERRDRGESIEWRNDKEADIKAIVARCFDREPVDVDEAIRSIQTTIQNRGSGHGL